MMRWLLTIGLLGSKNLWSIFTGEVAIWTLAAAAVLLLAFQYYRMRMEKQREILLLKSKAATLEKEKTQIQYENLKQQLNPHFLFNSLTSLRSLIRVDQKLAIHFLDGLSKSYRYLLRSGDKELVSLEEELNFVQIFIELQQTRFGKGLQVNIDVPEVMMTRMVAPVTVQNLLENAIKHNTTSTDQPLVVNISVDGNFLVVQNNLQRYRQVETSNKRGLASMQSLYRYLSQKPIEIIEDEKYFTVKIPLI